MIERLNSWVRGKRVLILGFGREGRSTWQVLKKLGTCACLDVADQREIPFEEGMGKRFFGPDYQKVLNGYDVVFKSPGIVLEEPPEKLRCEILSQTQVFFSLFRDRIIGITGTKGKSTVTSLMYHILKTAGRDVLMMGNIGIPAFDHLEEIGPETLIVFELSCHQLEYMTVSPHIALLINLYEEHLDHYGTMERYVQAKEQIFRHQRSGDLLVCNVQCQPRPGTCFSQVILAGINQSDVELNLEAEEGPEQEQTQEKKGQAREKEKRRGPLVNFRGSRYEIPADRISLIGLHNYFDIAMVYGVCRLMGVEDGVFTEGLKTYHPLPHRLQFVGEKDGVRYFDDSISTICDTAIQALKTLKDVDTVLIGGMDRGIDYQELIHFLSEHPVPHIILMEATGKRIFQEIQEEEPDFQGKARLVLADHLEDAVREAKKLTRPGRSCLLSPAAASYGIFRNFEERGETCARLALSDETKGK